MVFARGKTQKWLKKKKIEKDNLVVSLCLIFFFLLEKKNVILHNYNFQKQIIGHISTAMLMRNDQYFLI